MLIEEAKLKVKVENSVLKFVDEFDNYCSVVFHRTLRLPMDGKIYPLPPSLGNFPICKVDDYLNKVPENWKKTGGIFIPLYQREALWLGFSASRGKDYPFAMKIATGKINSVSGESWNQEIDPNKKQDYVVIPTQPWLDGINAGDGFIKQFVAMPKGSGHSIEQQVTGEDKFGGVQIIVYAPKKEKFEPKPKPSPIFRGRMSSRGGKMKKKFAKDSWAAKEKEEEEFLEELEDAPSGSYDDSDGDDDFDLEEEKAPAPQMMMMSMKKESAAPKRKMVKKKKAEEMSLSAGGKMKQDINKDPFGANTWDQQKFGRVFIHLVNSEMYKQITGKNPPPCPISAKTYSSYGYPWYDYYSEDSKDVEKSDILSKVKSVKEIDEQKYAWPQQDDSSIKISKAQVHTIKKDPNEVGDGDW